MAPFRLSSVKTAQLRINVRVKLAMGQAGLTKPDFQLITHGSQCRTIRCRLLFVHFFQVIIQLVVF